MTEPLPQKRNMGGSKYILKQVQVFFRHGARTPIVLVPAFEELCWKSVRVRGFDPQTAQYHSVRTPLYGNRMLRCLKRGRQCSEVSEVEYNPSLLTDVPHTVFNMEVIELETGGPQPYSSSEQWYAENTLKGGCKRGQLTTVGQVQTYSLGRRLRKDYIETTEFLCDEFTPRNVYLRSTNTARAIQSLRCCLAGMFGAEELTEKGPITVNVSDTRREILYGNSCAKNCPAISQLKQDAMVHSLDKPEFKKERIRIERALSIDSADEKYEKIGFVRLRDDVASREVHGLHVPPEAKVMRRRIEKNALKSFYYSICGETQSVRPHIMRLTGGPILTMVTKNLTSQNTTKLFMYAVHDWTILAILAPLGLYDEEWPPFSADIRIELYEDRFQEKFIQIKYLGVPQFLFGCDSTMCPFETFLAGVEPFWIDEEQYRMECQAESLPGSDNTSMDKGLETVI